MKKIIMSVLALGVLNTSLFADCSGAACTQVDITRLYMTDYGTIFVGTSGTESSLNCSANGGSYLSIRNADIGKNALFSLLLTAQTTKKKIDIGLEDGSPDCHIIAIAVN